MAPACCRICALVASAVGLLVFGWVNLTLFSCASVAKNSTVDAVQEAFRHCTQDQAGDKARGVFWVAGNTAPELLVDLECVPFDAGTRCFQLNWGHPYAWSWSTDRLGWTEFFLTQLNWWLPVSRLDFCFNEDYSEAEMFFRFLGRKLPTWAFHAMDEDALVWARGEYRKDGTFKPVYTVKKVLDVSGAATPAMEELAEAARLGTMVKDLPNVDYVDPSRSFFTDRNRVKTDVQLQVAGLGRARKQMLLGLLLLVSWLLAVAACWLHHRDTSRFDDGRAAVPQADTSAEHRLLLEMGRPLP